MRPVQEEARYLRDEDLGVDLLSARYVTHRFGLHTHDTYVIGVVVDGAARFACRGNTYVSPRGTIMLIEPEEAHTGGAGAERGWTYRMLYPTPSLLQRGAEHMGADGSRTPTFRQRVIEDPVVARALCDAHLAIEQQQDPLEKESRLLDAFGLLIQRHASAPPRVARAPSASDREHAATARRAKALIEERYASRLTLAELAHAAGASPFHLVRIFRKELGLPPHAYINQVRIRHAKDLLEAGVSLAAAAVSVGFSDQSHFGRHFKRTVGVSPARFVGSKRIELP
jgi:AraC-like DNA-binding protein